MEGSELINLDSPKTLTETLSWISVSDQLPPLGLVVLTYSKDHGVLPQSREEVQKLGNHRVDYAWIGPGPFSNFAHRVTHWMTLPAPPAYG